MEEENDDISNNSPKMESGNINEHEAIMNQNSYSVQESTQISSAELDNIIHNNTTNSTNYGNSMHTQNSQDPNLSDLSAHLASSGMAGVAAAAAIATSRRKSMLYNFEMVPAVRRRQSNRILRKIQQLVVEFAVRVGQQACVVICNPKSNYKPDESNGCHFKVFGASPLEGVIMNFKDAISNDLEMALQNYQVCNENSFFMPFETLPPLLVDGIPTPLDKMTQAQLRAFIPVMLKYSTGRNKPAWGRASSRPPWWPDDVPWANVRSDVRTDEEKQRQSWTNALKKVVRCCYEYHGKAHYLHEYSSHSKMGEHEIMDQSQMMESHHHHHQQQMDYDRMQLRSSGRHMMLNEHESVEAQLRALQTTAYSIATDQDGTISLVHLNNGVGSGDEQNENIQINNHHQVVNEYCEIGDEHQMHQESQQIKVEDLANLPPGTVVQLDSNSTSKLYNLINNQNNNDEAGMIEEDGGGGGNSSRQVRDNSNFIHDENMAYNIQQHQLVSDSMRVQVSHSGANNFSVPDDEDVNQ